MADAFVIQSADLTAGIVIVERSGVRFYAAEREFHGLDGRVFRNVRAARKAVDQVRQNAVSEPRPRAAFA